MGETAPRPAPVIHAVTTDDVLRRSDFVAQAAAVMKAFGPRGAVHVRGSDVTTRRLCEIADRLVMIGEATGAWVVINDRLDVALVCGAHAVQLTSRSLSISETITAIGAAGAARSASGEASISYPIAIGASVHSVDEARAAEAEAGGGTALSWLVAGNINVTLSHPGQPPRGPDFIAGVARAVRTPLIAIGGIGPSDVAAVLALGAHGVAAIRGIWHGIDAGAAAAEYLSAYDAARGSGNGH